MNTVEPEPVPTRVLNPNASKASYKSKQRSYRKTKLKKLFFYFYFFRGDFGRGDFVGVFYPGTGLQIVFVGKPNVYFTRIYDGIKCVTLFTTTQPANRKGKTCVGTLSVYKSFKDRYKLPT